MRRSHFVVAVPMLLLLMLAACRGDETTSAAPVATGGSAGSASFGGGGSGGLAPPDGGGGHGEGGSAGASCSPFTTTGRSWTLADIDVIGGAPIYPDLTLDPDDRPVVAFRKGTATLRYAAVSVFDGASWSAPETVDQIAGRFLGKRPSIAIESDGTMHVVAYDEDDWRPRHSTKAPGDAWSTTVIYQEGVDAGDHSSLAIDPAGTLHLSFTEYGTYHIVYGHKGAGDWAFETVADTAGPVTGGSSSLALAPSGEIHLGVYTGQPDEVLRHATGPGPVWAVTDVDTELGAGHYPTIAIDEGGAASLAYLRWADQDADVRMATRSGGQWSVDVVDTGLGISYTTAIATLGCGARAVAYGRNEGTGAGGLWFAYRNPGDAEWTRELVDGSSYVSGIDMVVDANGRIHLVYLDETDFVLEHAMLE